MQECAPCPVCPPPPEKLGSGSGFWCQGQIVEVAGVPKLNVFCYRKKEKCYPKPHINDIESMGQCFREELAITRETEVKQVGATQQTHQRYGHLVTQVSKKKWCERQGLNHLG